MTRRVVPFAALVWLAGFSRAAASELQVPVGARLAGMGDAGVAVSHEEAVYYNPAALGRLGDRALVAAWQRWFGDTSRGQLLYVHPLARRQAVGLSYGFGSTGGIVERSETNLALSTFSYTRQVVGASYGHRLVPGWEVGYAARYLNESIPGTTIRSVLVAEAGTITELPGGVRLGGAVKGLGRLRETAFLVGAAIDKPVSAAAGLTVPWFGHPYVGIGGEYALGMLAVRLGYRTGPVSVRRLGGLAGLTAGLGVLRPPFTLDYAFAPAGDLGTTHRVSLTYRFRDGRPGPERAEEEREEASDATQRVLARARRYVRRGQYFRATEELGRLGSVTTGQPEDVVGRERELRAKVNRWVARTLEPDAAMGETRDRFYAQAYQHYYAGRFQQAGEALERVLFVEPHNREAAEFRDQAVKLSAPPPASLAAPATGEVEPPVRKRRKPRHETPAEPAPPAADPAEVEQHYAQGLAEYTAGHLTEAQRKWEQVLRLDPAHEKARIALDRVKKELAVPSPR